jgi:hypothetical protein
MKGSVWERGDGRFGAEYHYTVNGVNKTFTTTKSTEEAANAWRAQKQADLEDGLLGPDTHSLSSYLDEWLKDAVEPSIARRTYQKRAWAVNQHIVPALGGTGLTDLEPRSIQSLYASMAREGMPTKPGSRSTSRSRWRSSRP